MVKNKVYSFQKMNKDLSESKNPESLYFDAKNLRFITNETRTTGSFVFEKGNKFVLSFPKPVINSLLKRVEYNTESGLKTLEYNLKSTSQPRCQLEEDYYISNNNYKQSGDQKIIGFSVMKDNILFITTDDNGFDCVWLVNDDTYELSLLYIRNLELSSSNLIQCITNFENDRIEKVYWVDGKNQMRFININHSIQNGDYENLIDLESSLINVVGNFKFTQPILVSKEQGGTHTAGMIQYAYSLYKLNGASTKLSPLSELISLDNGDGGGGLVNSSVGYYPVINIPFIDQDYTNIKLYSIKYTSYNELPEIRLILDKNIQSTTSLTHYDTGNIIETVSLEEFYFLGSNTIYIPKHINSKFNRLFSANYKEKIFDIKLDTRTYSFKLNNITTDIYESLSYNSITDVVTGNNTLIVTNNNYLSVPEKHNCLNSDFDQYKYQYNSNKIGGTGKYLNWELSRSEIGINTGDITKTESEGKFFKDREIYRLGIQFYNRKAQISLPKWITDFKVNVADEESNLNGFYATLKVTLNPDFFVWLNNSTNFLNDEGVYDEDLKPVGFKLLRAERTLGDKSIVSQGLINGSYVIRNTSQDTFGNYIPEIEVAEREKYNNHPKLPSLMRPFDGSVAPLKGTLNYARVDDNDTDHPSQGGGQEIFGNFFYGTPRNNGRAEIYNAVSSDDKRSVVYQFNQLLQFYSPDITFNQIQNIENTNLNNIGVVKNDYNAFWGKMIDSNTKEVHTEGKIFGAITPYSSSFSVTYPLGYDPDNPPVAPTPAEYQTYVDGLVSDHNATYGIYASEVPLNIPTYEEYVETVTSSTFGIEGEGLDPILGNIKTFGSWGLIGPQGVGENFREASYQPQYQLYRRYTGDLIFQNNPQNYSIYGNPLIVETGANRTIYNKDSDLAFYNTYSIMNTDSGTESDNSPNWRVKELNSWGAKCILFALGDNNEDTIDRTTLLTMFRDISGEASYNPLIDILDDGIGKSGIISELTLNKSSIYLGLLYGGNDYESRKRTNYIEIGDYINLIPTVDNELSYHCKNGGDTYISNFKFTKIVKTNIETYDLQIPQFTEIVEIKLESTVNNKNRSDYSIEDWDNRFQPKYEEYQNYNRVYSQEPNLFIRKDLDYNFRSVSEFSNNIIASKLKSPGELIDSWTSYLPNEVMSLDGKFGPINSLVSMKDEIFSFQDSAIAYVSISPRVQVQGNDGVSIQLGTGTILNDYKYITTSSGSKNKWSIIPTEIGIFYLDLLNRSFNLASAEGIKGLSDVEGFHKYFVDELDLSVQKEDNQLLGKGISIGWDKITNDVYLSMFKENSIQTLSFNTAQGGFSSFYDYNSIFYITTKGKTFTINPENNNELYQSYEGNYNEFYGVKKKSTISFLVNPEPMVECTLNNLEYKSEAVDINGNEVQAFTWNKIQVTNEFQDSNLRNLVIRDNIRKENRKWRISVPRDNGKTHRMRNTWNLVYLEAENENNYNYRNHDIIAYYNPNYKMIQ